MGGTRASGGRGGGISRSILEGLAEGVETVETVEAAGRSSFRAGRSPPSGAEAEDHFLALRGVSFAERFPGAAPLGVCWPVGPPWSLDILRNKDLNLSDMVVVWVRRGWMRDENGCPSAYAINVLFLERPALSTS